MQLQRRDQLLAKCADYFGFLLSRTASADDAMGARTQIGGRNRELALNRIYSDSAGSVSLPPMVLRRNGVAEKRRCQESER
jgi:hypothetical protein